MAKKQAKKSKSATPGHYTESGTRKYQTNGPIAWSREFVLAAHGGREGEGINAALAYAIAHRAEFQAWATRARKAAAEPESKAAKAPKAAKAKAAKAAKAPKAAKAKAEPVQAELPEVK